MGVEINRNRVGTGRSRNILPEAGKAVGLLQKAGWPGQFQRVVAETKAEVSDQ